MCDRSSAVQTSARWIPAVLEDSKPPTRRKKLWELDHHHHCSVIGTCLTLAELREIARKARLTTPAPLNDYELHVVFVNLAREAGPLSRLVQKRLDRKFSRALQPLTKTPSPQDMTAYWQAAVAAGSVAGASWALLTHPHTSKELLEQVYGEIHMLSHLAGASIRVDMQELDQLKRRCAQLDKQLAAAQNGARQRLNEKQALIDRLEQRLVQAANTERMLAAARTRLDALEQDPLVKQLEAEVSALTAQRDAAQKQAARAEDAAATWRRQAADASGRTDELEQQLAGYRQECALLEAALAQGLAQLPCQEHAGAADGDETAPDLVGRCVLYVGGRQGQCAHFRALVERCNGRFIHHDGGREQARAKLWDVVQQADAVLCPLDCISHDAVHRIKRFCKTNTKPLVLLPRASLAAFARGLNAVATGESL